jgi:hypothetical protein
LSSGWRKLTVFASLKEIKQNTKKGENIMFCCFAIFAGMFPRLADILIWIARPTAFMAAFNNNILWPILGIIFVPWTTMMYVIVFPGGVNGWDWLWLGLGLLGDIAWWAGGGFRRRVPGYTGQY